MGGKERRREGWEGRGGKGKGWEGKEGEDRVAREGKEREEV